MSLTSHVTIPHSHLADQGVGRFGLGLGQIFVLDLPRGFIQQVLVRVHIEIFRNNLNTPSHYLYFQNRFQFRKSFTVEQDLDAVLRDRFYLLQEPNLEQAQQR